MNLGFDAISQFPISQVAADNQVTVAINGNNLTLSIGPVSVAADAVTEIATGSPLTLGIGTVTIVGTASLITIYLFFLKLIDIVYFHLLLFFCCL